jgi:hypothetical protein
MFTRILGAIFALFIFVGSSATALACNTIDVSIMEGDSKYDAGGFVYLFTFDEGVNSIAMGEIGSGGAFSAPSLGNLGDVVAVVSPYKSGPEVAPANGHVEIVNVDGTLGNCSIRVDMRGGEIMDVQLSGSGPFAVAL